MDDKKYTLWFTNQNCQVMRGNVKPSEDYSEEELAKLRDDGDLTLWESMTADEIREAASHVSHNFRGGLNLALGYLDMYL